MSPLSPRSAPNLSLAAALALVPDTPLERASGVWYANYALARRAYGVQRVYTMTDPRIGRFFAAIAPLRPGPESGVASLVQGRWRQVYGYDLFQMTSEIYCDGGGGSDSRPFGVASGSMETAYVAHVLPLDGYARQTVGADRFFVLATPPSTSLPARAVNVFSMAGGYVIAGAWPDDVIGAVHRWEQGRGTLGDDSGYRDLAAALGPVEGAYLAANVPPSPYDPSQFPAPSGGHSGPALHHFSLFATAYAETRPGRREMTIALEYPRHADAVADGATLRARLAHESLDAMGLSWSRLVRVDSVAVRGNALVATLRLRPDAPPTLWQDVVTEGDLSILSQ